MVICNFIIFTLCRLVYIGRAFTWYMEGSPPDHTITKALQKVLSVQHYGAKLGLSDETLN